MRYLKTFQNNIENKPQVYDYVICNDYTIPSTMNTVGQIKLITDDPAFPYYIEFDRKFFNSLNDDQQSFFYKGLRKMSRKEIIYFSPNKVDLEIILTSNKYNI